MRSALIIGATFAAVGAVVGYLYPGPVTGALLPTGLLIWWIVYRLVRVG